MVRSVGQGSPRVLLSSRFVGTTLVGGLTVGLVHALADLSTQVSVLGVWVSLLAGVFLAFIDQSERLETRRTDLLEKLENPVSLVPEHDLFHRYKTFSDALARLATQRDPVLRQFRI